MADTENTFSENVKFADGVVKYKYKENDYTLHRPAALVSAEIQDKLAELGGKTKELVQYYIEVVTTAGMPSDIANKLDLFTLTEIFRALSSPPVKKK